jgi:hypothetical protein
MHGYQPKERIQYSEHGEYLIARTFNNFQNTAIMFCVSGKETESNKISIISATDKRELKDESKFQIISTKDGSAGDQFCFLLHILYRSFIGFCLLFKTETLFPTRNEVTRTTCSTHYRKLSPIYYP